MKMSGQFLLWLVAVSVMSGCSDKENVLHLYNWNQYIAPQTVERFEQACSCKVELCVRSFNGRIPPATGQGATAES